MTNSTYVQRVALLSMHTSPLSRPGSGSAGGMNLYVRRLAEELSRAGKEVDVFTRRTDARTPEVIDLTPSARVIHLEAGPVRPVTKSLLPLHIPAMVASLRSYAERCHVSYDVLHSHYWLSGVVALRFRDDPRVPVIHMFHTLARVKEQYAGAPDPRDSALRVDAEGCITANADVVVGATDGEPALLEKLYGKRPQLYRVIPPGVDLDVFAPRDKKVARALLGIDAEQVILFAGRLDPIKGVDVLLRSVAAVRISLPSRLKVVVVGGSGDAGSRGTAPYRNLARRLGIDSLVDFRGPVSQEDLPLYYSAADVCAVPSAYESFGMVALEAMACQTPVVAFAAGGLEATVKHGQTGLLVEPGSIRSFSEALHAALTSPSLEIMGRRGRLAAHRFTWRGAARSTATLYEAAVSARLARYERVSSAC